jgi:hypothetical protein
MALHAFQPAVRACLTALLAAALLLAPMGAEATEAHAAAEDCAVCIAIDDLSDHSEGDGHDHHEAHGCGSCPMHGFGTLEVEAKAPSPLIAGRFARRHDAPRKLSPSGLFRPPRV